jgi:hypothetical protein
MAAAALALANPERRRGEREVERRSGVARASPTQEGMRTHGNAVGRGRDACREGAGHGRHVPDMWPPQGHFNEHVVAYEVGKVEGDFGPVLG